MPGQWLFSYRNGIDQARRRGGHVDHEQTVVRRRTVKPTASGVCNTEVAHHGPSLPSGVICALVGGPSSEFINASRARIAGFAGLVTVP